MDEDGGRTSGLRCILFFDLSSARRPMKTVTRDPKHEDEDGRKNLFCGLWLRSAAWPLRSPRPGQQAVEHEADSECCGGPLEGPRADLMALSRAATFADAARTRLPSKQN